MDDDEPRSCSFTDLIVDERCPPPSAGLEKTEFLELLLDRLDEREMNIVIGRYYENRPFNEIALEMKPKYNCSSPGSGLSESTVGLMHSRILDKLGRDRRLKDYL